MKRLVAPVCCLVALVAAQADVLIYSLSFSKTGETVNFSTFDGGYLVVDEDAGSFSSIIIIRDPDTSRRYYEEGVLSGSYFDLLEEGTGDLYGVLDGSGNGTIDSLGFQAVGKAQRTSVGGGARLNIPRTMSGFLLSNSEETPSIDRSGSAQLEYGYVGASKVKVRYDERSTRDANNARLDAAATTAAIVATLERRGITPPPTPTPTPTPRPSQTL